MCAMAVLVIHLDKEAAERKEAGSVHGLDLAISLYREYEELSPIVIIPPSNEALRFNGSAFFSFVFRSPITEHMALASSALSPGYSLYRLGYNAVVITGRARKLSAVTITADGAERTAADNLRGLSSLDAEVIAKKNITDVCLSVGRAGENGVLYASLQSGGNEVAALGLGCLFGWKNIKIITMPGFSRKDDLGNGKLEHKVRRRQERNGISKAIRKEGGGRFIDALLRLGALPVRYYSDRFDPRAFFLDGRAMMDEHGVYPESCQECFFACGRRTRDNERLPSWKECAMLGSNLGFFSITAVRKLSDAVSEEGLGISDTGALLSYLSSLPGTDYTLPSMRGKGIDDYVALVHSIGENITPGDKLSIGLKAFPDAVQMSNHLPLVTDLRGDKAGAVMASLSLPDELPASVLLPHRALSDKAAAIMAFYESAYRYALVSEGYNPMGTIPEWWGRLPWIVFRIPFILRIAALLFSAYGKKGRSLLMHGISLVEEFSQPGKVPELFTSEPCSAFGDGATVSQVRVMENYEREKRIAFRVLKSRSEKRVKPSSDSTAAVGPSDDLGRDGDPGLQNTTPSSS